jgi:hypothetical protein
MPFASTGEDRPFCYPYRLFGMSRWPVNCSGEFIVGFSCELSSRDSTREALLQNRGRERRGIQTECLTTLGTY